MPPINHRPKKVLFYPDDIIYYQPQLRSNLKCFAIFCMLNDWSCPISDRAPSVRERGECGEWHFTLVVVRLSGSEATVWFGAFSAILSPAMTAILVECGNLALLLRFLIKCNSCHVVEQVHFCMLDFLWYSHSCFKFVFPTDSLISSLD